jgi:hypothetical protein
MGTFDSNDLKAIMQSPFKSSNLPMLLFLVSVQHNLTISLKQLPMYGVWSDNDFISDEISLNISLVLC